MDDMRLDGQVAIITGAGRGLGKSYALALAARGAKVLVNNRIRAGQEHLTPVAEEVAGEITAAGGVAAANTADLSTAEGARSIVQAALDAFGRIDIVVNNAGIVHFHTLAEYPDDEFDEMMAIQFRAAWFLTQAAWPHFIAQGYGRVVNTVSRGGFFGDPHGAAYAAAKGATYSFTRALAVEGREHGIRVNAICPVAWTPLYARAADVSAERQAELEANFRTDRVAPVVVALAHESCPFTGEVIMAAGGQVNRLYIAHTEGVHLDGDFTPEDVFAALPEIWSEEGAFAMGLVGEGRGGGTPRTVVPPEAQRAGDAAGGHDVAALARHWIESYNAFDIDAIEAITHTDAVMHHHLRGPEVVGADAIISRLRGYADSGFPERHFEPARRVLVDGDTVVVEHDWVGRPAGGGDETVMKVGSVFVFADGLVIEHTEYG